MKDKVCYEWCYETVDENGDIDEVDFEEKLINFQDNRKTDTLCLMRREGNEIDGEQDRLYAYVENGKLPETFSDCSGRPIAINVPQKFIKELSNYYEKRN